MTSSTLKSTPERQSQKPNSNGAGRCIPEINLKEEAIQLRQSGASLRQIATRLNISHEWARSLVEGEPRGQQEKPAAETKIDPQMEALKLLASDFSFHCVRLRRRLRKTQQAFGKMIGVGNPSVTVSLWESGKHVPQKKYLLRFMALQKQFDNKTKKRV